MGFMKSYIRDEDLLSEQEAKISTRKVRSVFFAAYSQAICQNFSLESLLQER